MASVVLPLRIRAEPIANSRFGKCFLLPSVQADDDVCLVIQQGIVSLACSTPAPSASALSTATGIDLSMMPPLLLAMPVQEGGRHAWLCWDQSMRDYVKENERDPHVLSPPLCSRMQAKAVIQGIHRYYSRQVLEPSIRGFLSILEKTFPRNDLYLFELLQNAVDDGAMKVCFIASPNGQALMFRHNGRPFAALDCLGLASVGLSTKADGGRRTIGFMGIGFKAVYKRFAKVTVYNDTWCFTFAKSAASVSAMEPLHAWVMKPVWSDSPPAAAVSFKTQAPQSWCHFVLENPFSAGSSSSSSCSIFGDMRSFPSAVPALLSRQAFANKRERDAAYSSSAPKIDSLAVDSLAGSNHECWTLEWNEVMYRAFPPNGSMNLAFPRTSASRASGSSAWSGGCDCIRIVQEGEGSRNFERLWQFITLQFVPDADAQAAYEAHTRRKWRDSNSAEETCLFFQIGSDGMVIDDASCRGTLHAVLPTKLKLPCGLNWQASWLLSVDRQDVQSVSDNAWNRCLLFQAPKLFACLVAWAAAAVGSKCKSSSGGQAFARTLECTYALLPPLTLGPELSSSSSRRSLSCTILGQTLPMDALADVLYREDVVPCHDASGLIFLAGRDVMWLPPSLLQISPVILRTMFGMPAFAADLAGKSSWLSMWRASCVVPTESTLRTRRPQFKSALCNTLDMSAFVTLALKFFAALAVASQEQPPAAAVSAAATDNSESKAADLLCGGWLPALKHWPVFPCAPASMINSSTPTASNSPAQVALCCASEMIWLAPDFAALPSDVRAILRVGACVAGKSILADSSGGHSQSAVLLHPAIQDALDTSSNGFRSSSSGSSSTSDDISRSLMMARKCVSLAIEFHPHLVVGIETAAFHFFETAAAEQRQLRPEQDQSAFISHCVCLCRYAMSVSKPRLMTHLLIDTPLSNMPTRSSNTSTGSSAQPAAPATMRKLVRATACFIGAAYDKQEGVDLEAISEGVTANFVSQIYVFMLDSSAKSMAVFFAAAGAQNGLFIANRRRLCICVVECLRLMHRQATAGAPQSEHIKLLDGAVLPKLRGTVTSCDIHLPYNLGLLTRKSHMVVDITFARICSDIIGRAASSPVKAAIVCRFICRLLASTDAAEKLTPESIPSAAAALKGKERDTSESQDNGVVEVGTRKHGNAPIFKRMFYLPPAQAGASAANVGLASWVSQLGRCRWLPCASPGAPADSPPTLVLSPSECILQSASAPAAASDIPSVRVSASMAKVLAALPAAVAKAWQWGSVKPKPPLERLEHLLLVDIPESEPANLSLSLAGTGIFKTNSRYYDELVALWRSLALAAQEKRLLPADIKKVQSVVDAATSKGVRCIPAADRCLWSWSQCADIQAAAAAVAAATSSGRVDAADESLAALSFHEAGLMMDVGSNNEWPLYEVVEGMRVLLKPSAAASVAAAVAVVSWFTSTQPRVPSPLQLRCFSLGLWLIIKPKLGRDGLQPVLPDAAVTAASAVLESASSNLRVYCSSGPGIGSFAYPARWLSIWKDDAGDGVTPVLLDEAPTNSGISKASLLRPEHKLQPLGCLLVSTSASISLVESRVSNINGRLLQVLRIPRTSDSKAFSIRYSWKSAAAAAQGEPMHAASELMGVVFHLLHSLCKGAGDDITCLVNSERNSPFEAELSRHRHLSIQFKPPKADMYDVKNVYAVWGLPVADPSAPRSLYVCGDADDYAPELEDILVAALVPSSHRKQPMILRALRLLYFLEDAARFLKHFDRNFEGFNGVQLPPILVRLKQRSATDAENFLAALSSNNSTATSLVTSADANHVNQRGVSNLPAWMSQESGGAASEQTSSANKLSASPPPSSGIKVAPPKRLEIDAIISSPSGAQTTAAGPVSADRSSDRVGERGISNLPAWMTQDAASAAADIEGTSSITVPKSTAALSEIKIPVPKTAAEAAVAFPLLSLAAGAKRDRVSGAGDCAADSAKRQRESSAAALCQEVAMLLLDAEADASAEQQHLEALVSKAVTADDVLRSVS